MKLHLMFTKKKKITFDVALHIGLVFFLEC